MLYWNRLRIIIGIGLTAFCLTGCSMFQPIFSPKPTADQALDIVSSAVGATNLWWPITFAGFLALLAGTINLVFLRGGAKLLIIGLLLALTPPIADILVTNLAPWISIIVGIMGLGLLGIVFGRWFGRRDIMNRAQARANYIESNGKAVLTKGQTADVLNHLGDKNFEANYPI